MVKCIKCGRTAKEILEQDGSVTVESDMAFVCEKCKHMEDFNQQIELLKKAIMFDNLQTKIDQLKQQLAEKDVELLKFRKEKLYFELLITRLQWLHKRADDCRLEKERFGVDDMSLCSVWDVLELQKNDLCEYEEMHALQEGIECVAKSKLLGNIEHNLQVKATRNENEIFKDIEQIDQQIKLLKGEKDVED